MTRYLPLIGLAAEASERTAFQRGAEKMREMAAGVVDENTRDAFDEDLAAAIRDLPIPTPEPEGNYRGKEITSG